MDREKYLVAVASSDGIVVNSHFGRARLFYIYEVEQDESRFIETREVTPICDGGNHDDDRLRENFLRFSDCKFLLVSRIGNGAACMAESLGIEAYEIPGEIKESIEQLIKYIKLKKLFE